jgi:hypothetical protein
MAFRDRLQAMHAVSAEQAESERSGRINDLAQELTIKWIDSLSILACEAAD